MTGWTTPADVERKLRRRWQAGTFLARYAEGLPWEPLALPLRGPSATEVGSDLERVRSWVRSWERAAPRLGRLEHRRVGGRMVGANHLPGKLWLDSYQQLWSALGVTREAARFVDLVDAARAETPRLVEWMLRHPLRVLELGEEWRGIVDTVRWIDARPGGQLYLRQVDVPGVDTKFIDRHRATLAALLDLQLGPGRIDRDRPRSDFAGRYGFRQRPQYVRLRTLGAGQRLAGGFTEWSVRVDELAEAPPEARTVFVVENETTYLALPPVPDAVAVLGSGYAAAVLESLPWLSDRDLVYWGDIDTHGFAILDRLRRRFPHARSMLMDRATLLAHQGQWVREATPHVAALAHLHPAEAALYRDLVEDVFGSRVRLEQERIRFSTVEQAVATAAR